MPPKTHLNPLLPGPGLALRLLAEESLKGDFAQRLRPEGLWRVAWALPELLCTFLSQIFCVLLSPVIFASYLKRSSGNLFSLLLFFDRNKHFTSTPGASIVTCFIYLFILPKLIRIASLSAFWLGQEPSATLLEITSTVGDPQTPGLHDKPAANVIVSGKGLTAFPLCLVSLYR